MGATENVFDESGQTVATVAVTTEPEAEVEATEPVEQEVQPPAVAKYRIGDRYFETQDQAIEYAQSHIQAQEADAAYRQGMQDALTQQPAPAQSVTPPQPAVELPSSDELYTNPNEYLRKRDEQVEARILARVDQQSILKTQSDNIWSEFTQRHPMLADFRSDVESFASQNTDVIRGIARTKGMPATYDFIATKLKAKFEQYSTALKPRRELPNTGAGVSPSTKTATVTQKTDIKKPLSFAEQVRSIRKSR